MLLEHEASAFIYCYKESAARSGVVWLPNRHGRQFIGQVVFFANNYQQVFWISKKGQTCTMYTICNAFLAKRVQLSGCQNVFSSPDFKLGLLASGILRIAPPQTDSFTTADPCVFAITKKACIGKGALAAAANLIHLSRSISKLASCLLKVTF